MNQAPEIRCVIFDVGEVIFKGFYGAERHISECVGRRHTNADLQTDELMAYFRGEITESRMWEMMKQRFGWSVPTKNLKKAVRKNFTEVPGTKNIVIDLDLMDYPLGILSVHGREWVRYICSRYNYHSLFRHISYSYCGGPCKPDPEAFHLVARHLGCTPNECLVVDDYHVNISSAGEAGFQTHQFVDAPRLRKFLVERRVLAA